MISKKNKIMEKRSNAVQWLSLFSFDRFDFQHCKQTIDAATSSYGRKAAALRPAITALAISLYHRKMFNRLRFKYPL